MNKVKLLFFSLGLVIPFCGCSQVVEPSPYDEPCQYHIDLDGNGLCENCGLPVIPEPDPGLKDFEGLIFNDQTFNYDGTEKSIYVGNAPSFAKITYIGNGQIEPGEYRVDAIVSADGYNACALKAKMTIVDTREHFENLVFASASFDYDGESHSILVQNVPSFATATYSGNNKTEPGVYTVHATVSAPNYATVNLSATLTIIETRKQFENLVFQNLTVDYDGETHSIYVQNVPSFATVKYVGNGVSTAGTHSVTATVKASGYKDAVLTAKIIINAKEFSGIIFEDKEFTYDGYYHEIKAENVPSFATVTYTNNKQKTKGTYTATATISASNYKTLKLTAKLTISNRLPEVNMPDRTLFYDGTNQKVKFILPDLPIGLSRYVEATYYIDGKQVEEDKFVVKTLGTHTAKIVLTDTSSGQDKHDPSTTTATIKVVNNTVGTTDPSKTAFKITKNLKYQTLRSKILEGNFTLKVEVIDAFDRDKDSIYEESDLDGTYYHYFSNGEVFTYYNMNHKDDNPYDLDESIFTHVKTINDQTVAAVFSNGVLNYGEYGSSYVMPKDAFEENLIGRIGLASMAYLKEDTDGGFKDGQEGGSSTTFGTFSIDEAKNCFTQETNTYYYHKEFNHSERCVYTIYNIGNTKINMLDELRCDKVDYSVFSKKSSIEKSGITYCGEKAYIEFDSIDKVYNAPGTYIIEAVYDGDTVTRLDYTYYYPYYNLDLSQYTFCVYFDNYGNYQGDYEELGNVAGSASVNRLSNFGATIKYYGEW